MGNTQLQEGPPIIVLVLYAAGKNKFQENCIFKVLKVSIKHIMHAERQKV